MTLMVDGTIDWIRVHKLSNIILYREPQTAYVSYKLYSIKLFIKRI